MRRKKNASNRERPSDEGERTDRERKPRVVRVRKKKEMEIEVHLTVKLRRIGNPRGGDGNSYCKKRKERREVERKKEERKDLPESCGESGKMAYDEQF